MKEFPKGQLVMTRSVSDMIIENEQFSLDVVTALSRYTNMDWGEMGEEDKQLNDDAVREGYRTLGAYDTCEGKVWVITEWDRSYTTILFPSEY